MSFVHSGSKDLSFAHANLFSSCSGFFGTLDPNFEPKSFAQDTSDYLISAMNQLAKAGARHFLVPSTPALQKLHSRVIILTTELKNFFKNLLLNTPRL